MNALVKISHNAGQNQALIDLGLIDDTSFEKNAFLNKIVPWAAKAGGRLLFGKPGQEASKGLLSRAIGTGGKLISETTRVAGKPFSNLGQGVMQAAQQGHLGRWMAQPQNIERLRTLGKGLPTHMGGFGVFRGVHEAVTAQPGEDKFKAFAKGFGHGAMLGGVMGLGGNIFRMTATKAIPGLANATKGLTSKGVASAPRLQINPNRSYLQGLNVPAKMTNIQRRLTRPQRAAKALLGTGAFLAGDLALTPLDASLTKGLYDIFTGQPTRPVYQYPQIYTAPAAAIAQRYGYRMGLHPGNQLGYAPGMGNIPFRGQQ
jgi:hypothetical protein